jgi:hypothetical protein
MRLFLASYKSDALDRAAMRADRAIRPANSFKRLAGKYIIAARQVKSFYAGRVMIVHKYTAIIASSDQSSSAYDKKFRQNKEILHDKYFDDPAW